MASKIAPATHRAAIEVSSAEKRAGADSNICLSSSTCRRVIERLVLSRRGLKPDDSTSKMRARSGFCAKNKNNDLAPCAIRFSGSGCDCFTSSNTRSIARPSSSS